MTRPKPYLVPAPPCSLRCANRKRRTARMRKHCASRHRGLRARCQQRCLGRPGHERFGRTCRTTRGAARGLGAVGKSGLLDQEFVAATINRLLVSGQEVASRKTEEERARTDAVLHFLLHFRTCEGGHHQRVCRTRSQDPSCPFPFSRSADCSGDKTLQIGFVRIHRGTCRHPKHRSNPFLAVGSLSSQTSWRSLER